MRGDCLPLRLLAELPPDAASLQANSAVPNWIFTTCRHELQLLQQSTNHSVAAGVQPYPWVQHGTKTRRQ